MLTHPHHYTLALLKHLLDKADHTLFPAPRLLELRKEYALLAASHETSQTKIEQTIARFGKEIWPYQEALEELYRRYGKKKEESLVREKLEAQLREKYDHFLEGGGDLTDFRHPDIETYFTPEEKFQIGQAVLEASHTVFKEIASACNVEHKDECEGVISEHKEKLERIEKKLVFLKELADTSEKWRPEIEEKIRAFEESFGYLTKTFHEEDIDGAIDYYRGVIEEPEYV